MILIEHHVMVKVNNTSRFFRDKIEIFSNLVVRDEIEICFFYISCFETRSRICFTTSRISRRGRETKQLILEVEREFSMLILARHFEIENSRQCLCWRWRSPMWQAPSTRSWRPKCSSCHTSSTFHNSHMNLFLLRAWVNSHNNHRWGETVRSV